MRRLPRIILNIVTVLSLVLCVAMVVLWARSYYAGDAVRWHTKWGDRYSYLSYPGAILLEHQSNEVFYPPADKPPPTGVEMWTRPQTHPRTSLRYSHPHYEWRAFGYGWVVNRGVVTGRQGQGQSVRPGEWRNLVIILPYWVVILLAAIPPTSFVIRSVGARSRKRTGLCPSCGYDLRATPDRCPECGAIPAQA